MTSYDPNEVAYYFYRPVVREKCCSLGKVHRQTVGYEYFKRLRNNKDVEITKDEYERRPRFERP